MEHLYDIIIEGQGLLWGHARPSNRLLWNWLPRFHKSYPFYVPQGVIMFGKTQIKLESKPKNTAQGRSNNTRLSATSRNGRKKRYRGQGKWFKGAYALFFYGSKYKI